MNDNNTSNNETNNKKIIKYLIVALGGIALIIKGFLAFKNLDQSVFTPTDPKAEAECRASIQGAIDTIKTTNSQILTLQDNYQKLGTNDMASNFLFLPINTIYSSSINEVLPKITPILTAKINPTKYKECISMGKDLEIGSVKIQSAVAKLNNAALNAQISKGTFQKALDCQTKEECDAITETLFTNESQQKQYTSFNADISSLNILNKIYSDNISNEPDIDNCAIAAKNSIELLNKSVNLNNKTINAISSAGIKNTPIETLFSQSILYNNAYNRKWISVAEKISQKHVNPSEVSNCLKFFKLNDELVNSGIKENQGYLDNLGRIEQAISQKKAGFSCKDLSSKNIYCIKDAISLMDTLESFSTISHDQSEAQYKKIIEFSKSLHDTPRPNKQ